MSPASVRRDTANCSLLGQLPPFSHRPTTEQNKVTDLVRNTVESNHGDPNSSRAEGGQPLSGAASLDNNSIDPDRSNAVNDQCANSTPQSPAKHIGEIPSSPPPFPVTPQPISPTKQRIIELRNGKSVAVHSKAKIKRLDEETKRLKKLNDKKHRNHFGESGSKST